MLPSTALGTGSAGRAHHKYGRSDRKIAEAAGLLCRFAPRNDRNHRFRFCSIAVKIAFHRFTIAHWGGILTVFGETRLRLQLRRHCVGQGGYGGYPFRIHPRLGAVAFCESG